MTFLDFRHFNEDLFKAGIKSQYWSLATENNDTDLTFKTFLHLLNKPLDKHARFWQVNIEK